MVHDSTPIVILLPFTPMVDPRFVWGGIDADSLMHSITAAYAEVVNWRRNIFAIPLGNAGKGFVNELACLFKAYAERTALEAIALTATMVIPSLLLQKPHRSSKTRDHIAYLGRLQLWKAGNINSLILEELFNADYLNIHLLPYNNQNLSRNPPS